MKRTILATLATAALFSAAGANAQTVADKNGVLADATGRTLYTFTKDAPGKSNCNAGCAAAWPPFMVKDGDKPASGFTAVTRDDGSRQWAMGGKPLYYFAADTQPGDVKGDGQGGVWHVIRKGSQGPAARPAGSGSY